jgi:protein phosphatase
VKVRVRWSNKPRQQEAPREPVAALPVNAPLTGSSAKPGDFQAVLAAVASGDGGRAGAPLADIAPAGRAARWPSESEAEADSATAIAGVPQWLGKSEADQDAAASIAGPTPAGPAPQPGIIGRPTMMEAIGLSDPGCVRPNNEDFFALVRERGLYIVADGMGGAQAGEHASRLAVETVVETILNTPQADADRLAFAFQEANRRVMEAAAGDAMLEGMGTTLVAALECGSELLIASVGDSRAYVFDGNGLVVVTEDQTWVQEVGRRLGIDEESLRTHPMRHVLTMAIGVSSQLRLHSYALQPQPGMQVLLSSDGLHGVVPAEAIGAILAGSGGLEQKCRLLIGAAREAGGPDNITVVLLQARG